MHKLLSFSCIFLHLVALNMQKDNAFIMMYGKYQVHMQETHGFIIDICKKIAL